MDRQIHASRLVAIGKSSHHAIAAGAGLDAAGVIGCGAWSGDSSTGTSANASFGAAGCAVGATDEVEIGLGSNSEISSSSRSTGLRAKHLDVGFTQSRTSGAGSAKRGRIGGAEVQAGIRARQGGGVHQALDAADLGRQIETIHATKPENTGRGIACNTAGAGDGQISRVDAQVDSITCLHTGGTNSVAVEINASDGADGIGGSNSRSIGLQAAGSNNCHWFGGIFRGAKLKFSSDGNDVEDVVIPIRLNAAIGGGKTNPITIDQREVDTSQTGLETVGEERWVKQAQRTERFVANRLGRDTIIGARRSHQVEIGTGLNALGVVVGEVGIVDAVGPACQSRQGQAADIGGAYRLAAVGIDGEAEGIASREAGIAATRCLNGATGSGDIANRRS